MSHGHLSAKVDPLELDEVFAEMDLGKKYGHTAKAGNILCDYKHWGLTEADLDRKFYIDVPQLAGLLQKKKDWTLREIDDAFREAYCGNIGIEYMHIQDREQCNWIRNKFELRQFKPLTDETKIHVLDRLLWADGFANFL